MENNMKSIKFWGDPIFKRALRPGRKKVVIKSSDRPDVVSHSRNWYPKKSSQELVLWMINRGDHWSDHPGDLGFSWKIAVKPW